MYCLLFGLILATVGAQTTLDPKLIQSIFGDPPGETTIPTEGPTSPRYNDITVKPTDSSLVTPDSGSCKCVPYYLCDSNSVGVDINNASVTGYGVIDVRFGEGECTESVEICCTAPKDSLTPKPRPDPSKLKGCGYRNPNGVTATFTGTGAASSQFGEFPWVVGVLDVNNQSTFAGAGALIHPQVVITGAHVAAKFTPRNMMIRAGEWDRKTVNEIYDYEERNVAEIFIHPDFQPKSLKNNVALLRLETPLELAEHINVICLPDPDESFDNYRDCVANGWGQESFGSKAKADFLKKVEINMVAHDRCNSLLKRTRLGPNFKLHSSFVCAGGEEGKDTCRGDGGAPLACPVGNNRYKLTGLVSWGIGCGDKDVPAVYAKVAAFRRLVDDKMAAWGLQATSYRT